MKTRNLLLRLSKLFPKRIANENHDYVGLMVGKLPMEVNSILLCLDLDEQNIDDVIKAKPDLIITHHPFIYGNKTKVLKNDLKKRDLVEKVLKNNLVVYSMHTNFDGGKGGMNDALCNALNLKNVRPSLLNSMMRIGDLDEEMDVISFAKYANSKLNVDYSHLINEGTNTIKTVAIIGGGGSYYWSIAKLEGADIYISGDVSHHVRRDIVNDKFNFLDMPHEIEKIFMPTMTSILKEIDSDLKIIEIDHEKLPKIILN